MEDEVRAAPPRRINRDRETRPLSLPSAPPPGSLSSLLSSLHSSTLESNPSRFSAASQHPSILRLFPCFGEPPPPCHRAMSMPKGRAMKEDNAKNGR